jgi:hypothetical protein
MSTREKVEAAHAAYLAAFRALDDAREHKAPAAERCKLSLRADAAAQLFNATEQAARETFAKSRGWKYDRKLWARDDKSGQKSRRIIKHTEGYRDAITRKAVALISHTDCTLEEIESYAAKNNYAVEVLPWSWCAPGVYRAAIFTLQPGAKWKAGARWNTGATWPKK